MKKRIKDLTQEEFDHICEKVRCYICLFKSSSLCLSKTFKKDVQSIIDFLNKEVEIPDEEE